MQEDRDTPGADENANLEREIRAGREFSLTEAIGRMAGGGMMKGASPVSRRRQAELTIQEYLRRNLTDAGGVLGGVVLRHVEHLDACDDPLHALVDYVRHVLTSDSLLRDLVREADEEWGRQLGERPYFQRADGTHHPADPYTFESVRLALSQLVR
jgi:hypothetical protein